MSKQPNATSTGQQLVDDQTVQTKVEEGKWMFLQEATDATGLSEKTLRRYIKRNAVKSRRLGKQTNSPFQLWITSDILKEVSEDQYAVEGIQEVFDADTNDVDQNELLDEVAGTTQEDFSTQSIERRDGRDIGLELDRVIKTIAQQFAEKLDQQTEVIHELKHELTEKETQLRLLPDLQKQLEEKEKLADFQTKALEKHVEELNKENERLREEAETSRAALELAQQKQPWWKKWVSS